MAPPPRRTEAEEVPIYRLDEQVGFVFRRAIQRHLTLFTSRIPGLTPTQFAAIAKLAELNPVSQNELGRRTAMDAATIKGVIDRLRKRGLVTSRRDPDDQRRIFLQLSSAGRNLYSSSVAEAHRITQETLAPLNAGERELFLSLLKKMI